ncbi:MAG: SAM-dependent methyltransferase [Nocardioidaceae bacterium]
MRFEIVPVGRVANDRNDPQESDHWGGIVGTIDVDPRFPEDSLQGLEEFSHAEVVCLLDRFEERTDYKRRPPRGRTDLPSVGVFADRGPRRPNRLGISICEIVSVRGRQLRVRRLDAVDGTPVIDIKPVLRQYLPDSVHQPGWVDLLLSRYYLP